MKDISETEMFQTQKRNKDIIKTVHVTSVTQL